MVIKKSPGLKFDAETHTYYCDNKKLISVTEFIGRFFPKFDSDYWAKVKSKELGITEEEVKQIWKDKTNRGKDVHTLAEEILLDRPISKKLELENQIRNFIKDSGLALEESELMVFNEDLGIAGTIDLVMLSESGLRFIFDWKTNSKIKLYGYGNFAKYPIHHLQDCNFNRYSLQTSLYRMLSELDGNEIEDQGLVHLNEACTNYTLHECPYLRTELERMIEVYKEEKKNVSD